MVLQAVIKSQQYGIFRQGVITSYSIHYTKLYELVLNDPGSRPGRDRRHRIHDRVHPEGKEAPVVERPRRVIGPDLRLALQQYGPGIDASYNFV